MRYKARYVLIDDQLVENAVFGVEQGKFTSPGDAPADVDLGEVLVLPGLVNAHSHAFQRLIRGSTEHVLTKQNDNFWTWRDQMYRAALSMTPEMIYEASKIAYDEMVSTGITTVGEFHYVHHDLDGSPYDDPNELAHQVIRAAKEVGLRIRLLRVVYQRAGFGKSGDESQRRFIETNLDESLNRTQALASFYRSDTSVEIGIAPHSIRAVDAPSLQEIAQFASDNSIPLHIHACEQPREVEESIQEFGKPPVAVFEDFGLFEANTTLVHATHLSEPEHRILAEQKPFICACPTTERNLGDGFLPASKLWADEVPVCLGSDSHANIDLWEETRLLEYHERLLHQQRNVLAGIEAQRSQEARRETWQAILPSATSHGADSLSIDAGRIATGRLADFITIDLNHRSIRHTHGMSLLNAVALSMSPDAVSRVFVGGTDISVS